METLVYKNIQMNYTIIKKRKKHMSISVKKNGEIIVSIPNRISKKTAKNFVKLNAEWIYQKYNYIITNKKEKKFIHNENFLFFGKFYKLNIILNDKKRIKISIDNNKLNLFIHSEDIENKKKIRNSIIKWYKEKAKIILHEKYLELSTLTNLKADELRVRELKRSYGICYSHGKITINWKLIMCEEKIINYVILHELCHLKHLNHSKEFWNKVKYYMPDYIIYSNKLKELEKKFAFEI